MKKFVAMILAAMMVVSLVACSSASAPATETQAAAAETVAATTAAATQAAAAEAPASDEKVTLELYCVKTENQEAWQELERRFEELYPNVDIELITLEFSSGGSEFITARIAADDLPDVLQVSQGGTTQQLLDAGKIEDLKRFKVADDIPQTYKDLLTYSDGTLFGLAQGAAFATMYYNMDILEKAGWTTIPTNWDELMQCCQDVQDKTDAAPIVTSGQHGTLLYFTPELIAAHTTGLAQNEYEEQFKAGKFDWTAYPDIVKKMDQIQPYFITGAASMVEDDIATMMADGAAAMALAGNWTAASVCDATAEAAGGMDKVKASLPPFNEAGKEVWASVAPEDGFGLTKDAKRSEAEQNALDTFYEWLYQPENFKVIQNSSGSVPVLKTFTDADIKLPEPIVPVVAPMNNAPSILMGFNVWTTEYNDIAKTALLDWISGNKSSQEVVDTLWDAEQKYPKNK
ncbi:MAG: extracellular solute-binding protein [Eubacteriales bacterium]|nr:extracellular solute-binding protein [Eubacteriales bacterium]